MLSEMKYVYAVYQERSFSKAAKKLFISQPALSNMVKRAEREIGVPIFDRSTIPLTVTKAGSYYIQSIERILFIQRNMKEYFSDLDKLKAGTLSLGGSSYFCAFVFPEIISRFKEMYPHVSIELLEGNVRELRRGLEEESLDLVLETALAADDPKLEHFFYKNETIILAVPAECPVNGRLKPYRLSCADILRDRFLKPEVEAVPLREFKDTSFILMKPGNDMYQRSLTMCQNAGFFPVETIYVDQVMTSLNIAATGIGAVFVRSDIVKHLPEDKNLVYYKLSDPLAKRPVGFAAKKGRYVSKAMQEFLHLAGVRQL